jgi:hypothetical protein
MGGLAVCLLVLVRGPSRSRLRLVRLIAATVVVLAALGSGLHLLGNLEDGAGDERYRGRWSTMSPVQQLFLAATGGVGEAPILVPGTLVEISLALVLSTVRHPGWKRNGDPDR